MAAKKAKGPRTCLSPKGYWYCTFTVNGKKKQYSLFAKGPENEAQAWKEFEALRRRLDGEAVPYANSGDKLDNLDAVCTVYLGHLNRNYSAKRFKTAKQTLGPLMRDQGLKEVTTLSSSWLENWLKEKKTWGDSTKALAGATIKAAFNYSLQQGFIDRNPVAKAKLPKIKARIRYLTEQQEKKVLETARAYAPDFADFVWLCLKTGARPISEVAAVSCSNFEKHCDLHLGQWQLREHKTASDNEKARTVLLRDDVLAWCKKAAKKYPTGPLVRTSRGEAWTHDKAEDRWKRLRKKVGLDKSYTVYCLRHTFATKLLLAGVTMAKVAALMGNSVKVCEKHYGHLSEEKKHLKEMLELLG